jgi:DNA-binding response OmpR family regulator
VLGVPLAMMAANASRRKTELNTGALLDDSDAGVVADPVPSRTEVDPASVAPMRILVVDDEAELADAVARGLRREGYAVDVANDGEAALEKAAVTPYDLVCLDLTMPGIDGLEVCRRLREDPPDDVPPRVLMLTARDSIEDRITGLDHGADDYLVKPFAFGELVARVRSLLRREASRTSAVRRVGELELDDVRHRASRGDRELDLTAKEFALLRYFMAHPDEVLSQEHLLEHVWDEHADPFTNTVRVTVGTLRRKLSGSDEESLIETVIGSGYRLMATRDSADG